MISVLKWRLSWVDSVSCPACCHNMRWQSAASMLFCLTWEPPPCSLTKHIADSDCQRMDLLIWGWMVAGETGHSPTMACFKNDLQWRCKLYPTEGVHCGKVISHCGEDNIPPKRCILASDIPLRMGSWTFLTLFAALTRSNVISPITQPDMSDIPLQAVWQPFITYPVVLCGKKLSYILVSISNDMRILKKKREVGFTHSFLKALWCWYSCSMQLFVHIDEHHNKV